LGARMHHALSTALKHHDRAIVIGTDAPALSAQTIEQAFDGLAEHDAVFVPAFDGGYALVGLRRTHRRDFYSMCLGAHRLSWR